jgi:hypothetical protein
MRRPLAMCLALLAVACGSRQPTAPSVDLTTALPVTETSADYIFHREAGDAVETARQQAFHAWAIQLMDVRPGGPIHYYKYRDRSHMRQMQGRDTNGWANPPALEVHSIWPWDPHEAAHVLAGPLGQPTEFFNEGLAMAFSVDPSSGRFEPLWSNHSVHDWCAAQLGAGTLPSLADIVTSNAFRSRPEDVGYQTAGSFVRYLLDAHGIAALKQLFAGNWRDASTSTVNQRMLSAYGRSLAVAEAEWHAFLR